nr:uncharacterized protein LOC115264718 [Aedes albopictus]
MKAMKSAVQSDDGGSDRVCYFCKKPGHVRRNCRLYLAKQKNDEDEKKPDGRARGRQSVKKVEDEKCGASVCFMVAGREKRESWCIDSGASSHMTSDRNFFVSLDEKPGPNVILADGKIAATAGRGEGMITAVLIDSLKNLPEIHRYLKVVILVADNPASPTVVGVQLLA